jgi:hypothetical protein
MYSSVPPPGQGESAQGTSLKEASSQPANIPQKQWEVCRCRFESSRELGTSIFVRNFRS